MKRLTPWLRPITRLRSTTLGLAAASAGLSLLATGAPAQAQEAAAADTETLGEVIVTANRREQDVQDVPASLQVLEGELLEKLGANDFADYLTSISGVGMTRSGSGSVKVGLRGVSNVIGGESGVADSTSTVGLYLNDIPIQGSGPLPDLALYDVERVEVLKGPQGTLYGEGAMGGAIKMVMAAPDASALATKAAASLSSTEDGGTNYEVQGALNLPLITDRLAARLAVTYRDDSGFIDNIATGEDNVDSSTTLSARALVGWQITDAFSAEVLALHQNFDQDDFSDAVVGLGEAETNLLEDRYNEVDFNLYGLTLKIDFGGAELVSSSSIWTNERERFERAATVGFFLNFTLEPLGLPLVEPGDAQGFTLFLDQEAFTQELRLSSSGDQALDWTIGAFYRDAEQDSVGYDTVQDIEPINEAMDEAGFYPPSAIFPTDFVYESRIREQFRQTAVYGEIDWEFAPGLELKLGARWFEEDLDLYQRDEGLNLVALDLEFLGIPNPMIRESSAKDDDVIGRVGLSWHVDDEQMLYALVSQGFRSGGPNFSGGLAGTTVPELFGSDSLVNYEFGAKTRWYDGRLIANASLYRIDWSDVQVRVSQPTTAYIANAGEAEVTGGELQIIAAPTERWEFGFNLGVLDSEITSLGDGAVGRVGAPLPNAPQTTFSAYLQYGWPAGGLGSGFARFDYVFVDDQAIELIPATGDEDEFFVDSYDVGRLQIGVENERWSAYLFADNLWNEQGVTAKSRLNPPFSVEERISLIRPRTYGVRVSIGF